MFNPQTHYAMKVFVYGTLRKELGNHYFLQDSVFLGNAITDRSYVMLESSLGRSIPYVVKPNKLTKDLTTFVHGEVYEVDNLTLANLDRLEGHPGWYKREYVDVFISGDTKPTKAMIYFMPWSEFEDRNVLYVNTGGDFFEAPVEVPMSLLV